MGVVTELVEPRCRWEVLLVMVVVMEWRGVGGEERL